MKTFIKTICLLSVPLILFAFIARSEGAKMFMQKSNIRITSPAFKNNEYIPDKYNCRGDNVNPPLAFSGVPKGTKSIALIMDDPDSGGLPWVHWAVFNIPADVRSINENEVPDNALQGVNSFGNIEYGGPAAPQGPAHHYYFRLYALDNVLTLDNGAEREQIDAAMKGHILAQAAMVGLFKR